MSHKLWDPRFNAQNLVLIFHKIFEICAESELTMRSQNFKFKRNEKKLVTWFNFVNFLRNRVFWILINFNSEWFGVMQFKLIYSVLFKSTCSIQFQRDSLTCLTVFKMQYLLQRSKNSKSISYSLLSEIMVLAHDRTGHS